MLCGNVLYYDERCYFDQSRIRIGSSNVALSALVVEVSATCRLNEERASKCHFPFSSDVVSVILDGPSTVGSIPSINNFWIILGSRQKSFKFL